MNDINTEHKKCMNTFTLERNHHIANEIDRTMNLKNVKNAGKKKDLGEKDIFDFKNENSKEKKKQTKPKKDNKIDKMLKVDYDIGRPKGLKMKSY
tara:strand:+ start:582 stop:866 length:285 start_codon:yes stop_codon:yes gene_type:complete